MTGGLGPTDDDRTKEAVAKVLGRALVRDEAILLRLRERFRRRGLEMPKVNEKQADVIEGAVVLANPRGSAPGFLVAAGGSTVVLLPGVPLEMKAMWADAVEPLLARGAAAGLHRRTLKIAAMPESVVETLVKPVYAAYPEVPVHDSRRARRGAAPVRGARDARGGVARPRPHRGRFSQGAVGRDLRP